MHSPTLVILAAILSALVTAVLFAMIAGPFVIRYNHTIARLLTGGHPASVVVETPALSVETSAGLKDHVIICGYGRIGQSVGRFLEEEKIPFIALDLDPLRVREAHTAGEPVYYGDATQRDILDALGLERARLVVISHDDIGAALKMLNYLHALRPTLPVMVPPPARVPPLSAKVPTAIPLVSRSLACTV